MKQARIGALLAVTAIVFAACGGASTSTAPSVAPATPAPSTGASTAPSVEPSGSAASGTPKAGGTAVVAIPSDIKWTDSALVDDASSTYVMQNVMETLVTLKPGSGSDIVGDLADSWTISSDGLTYTFKLHPGIKFTDGTDYDADAVQFGVNRHLSGLVASAPPPRAWGSASLTSSRPFSLRIEP